MTGWQPIETAPKDGSGILVTYHPCNGKPPINAVRWSQGPQKSTHRWWIEGHTRRPLRYEPSHWHSLPAPPRGPGTAEGRMTACPAKPGFCASKACRVYGCQLEREAEVKAGWCGYPQDPTNREFVVAYRPESSVAVIITKETPTE